MDGNNPRQHIKIIPHKQRVDYNEGKLPTHSIRFLNVLHRLPDEWCLRKTYSGKFIETWKSASVNLINAHILGGNGLHHGTVQM